MGKKLLVILFGIVAIGVGIFLMISGNNKAKRCTTEAEGTVVEIIGEKQESSEADDYATNTYTYYPVIEYKAGERNLREKYSTGYGDQKYSVGDKVDILYDPNKPEDYLIKNDKTSNLLSIVFIAVGAVVVITGIVKRF